MIVTDEQVEDFNRAYEEAFGETLPVEEASAMLANLVELYSRMLSSPPPPDAPYVSEAA